MKLKAIAKYIPVALVGQTIDVSSMVSIITAIVPLIVLIAVIRMLFKMLEKFGD